MPAGAFPTAGQWKLTGATRVRLGFRNKLVLQVQKSRPVGYSNAGRIDWNGSETVWEDARIEDLQTIKYLTVGPVNAGLAGAKEAASEACKSLTDGLGSRMDGA